jgi:S1-C subfamily serine protease
VPLPPDPFEVPPADSRLTRGSILRTRARAARPFVLGIVAALLAVAAWDLATPAPAPLTRTDVGAAIASALASATPPPAFSELAYARIHPSLVVVQATSSGPPASAAGSSAPPSGGSLGSGVVVTTSGDILTALHVVADADHVRVTFADGSTSDAAVTTRSPSNDIAVLHPATPPANLPPATLGNPNAVRIGDEAFAVGNPLGLAGSLTSGVISGLDRSFEEPNTKVTLHGLIQIDAAVNPGSSGGPLLDRNGRVIGIVTALVNPTRQDSFAGIGLAVPIDVAGGAAGLPPD